MPEKKTGNRPRCSSCVHYHVTWEKEYPHGCRGYGFKSPESPHLVVKKTSGIECRLFEKKVK